MNNLKSITKNVNGEAKTFTAKSEMYKENGYCTVSVKSIYDRIQSAAYLAIVKTLGDVPAAPASDCGRFTFESQIVDTRRNGHRSISGAEINYQSRIIDNTLAEEDNDGSWAIQKGTGLVCLEFAKWSVHKNERTVFITPGSGDNSVSNWVNGETPRDHDCDFQYGTSYACFARLDDNSPEDIIEVDGQTYYANVSISKAVRKARLSYNGYNYTFSTPKELDAAIEDIIKVMTTTSEFFIEQIDKEEEVFNQKVELILKREQKCARTEIANTAIMGGAIKILEEAGFNKCESWHRQPAEGETGYYEIRMNKDTDLGVCSILCYQFREEHDWDYDANKAINFRHEVQFGFGFGEGSTIASPIKAHELHAKINKVVEMVALAC